MSNPTTFTPTKLLAEFRRETEPYGYQFGYKALGRFASIEDKSGFLKPLTEFVIAEKDDRVRAWGVSALGLFKGNDAKLAFRFLVNWLKAENTPEFKKTFFVTRFFALKSIHNLAKSQEEENVVHDLISEMWDDNNEHPLTQAGSSILLAKDPKTKANLKQVAEEKIRDMLSGKLFKKYRTARPVLRALVEFPLASVSKEIIKFVNETSDHYERLWAIRALGGYRDDLAVVRTLVDVYRKENDAAFRLVAVTSLGKLKHREAQELLLRALNDDNAEIRVQASAALKSLLGEEEATQIVVQEALRGTMQEEELKNISEALRRIDPSRKFSVMFLSRELDSQDLGRAQLARTFLTELGGWGALRKSTLDNLDRVLRTSEEGVNKLFNDTTRQARRNFYFAMTINAIIVFVGLSLVVFAIIQLANTPEKLESWIIPGTGGVFGIIITMYFNGPRKNAQKDLATLLNANVIYIGFLRRLTEIDATFKHLYLENQNFDLNDMKTTVQQIDAAVKSTIKSIEVITEEQRQNNIEGDPSSVQT